MLPTSFKTLSHLGPTVSGTLQNPVTSGEKKDGEPSKPCHIWAGGTAKTFKTLSHLGLGLLCVSFKTLSHLGTCRSSIPSKPCHIWVKACCNNLQNPVTSGLALYALRPSKPCHIWASIALWTFKTLSHLGISETLALQNPVTSGEGLSFMPSKPCHIWASQESASFKTLSHLGTSTQTNLQNPVTSGMKHVGGPSKPCHIWESRLEILLQNPVTSGENTMSVPSKPCHIWAQSAPQSFKTLSHLGDYHKSFVVHRKFGIKSM